MTVTSMLLNAVVWLVKERNTTSKSMPKESGMKGKSLRMPGILGI